MSYWLYTSDEMQNGAGKKYEKIKTKTSERRRRLKLLTSKKIKINEGAKVDL